MLPHLAIATSSVATASFSSFPSSLAVTVSSDVAATSILYSLQPPHPLAVTSIPLPRYLPMAASSDTAIPEHCGHLLPRYFSVAFMSLATASNIIAAF